MNRLFTTPIHMKIAELTSQLRTKIESISCRDLETKGVDVCSQEAMATVDNSFPSIDNELAYTNGGSQGPYFVVLATAKFTGSHDFFNIQPNNHFSRLPQATIDRSANTITFRCAVEEGQTKGETIAIASKELEFTRWYLNNLKAEWDSWYTKIDTEVKEALQQKLATCTARSSFINDLNS
jgi:hypothetical protein